MSKVTEAHMRLTDEEAESVETLTQLEQALIALHLSPVRERLNRTVRRIEDRLGLEAGSIGTTHVVDGKPLTVQERSPAGISAPSL